MMSPRVSTASLGDKTSIANHENIILIVANERMLSSKQVQERTGLSRTTIWRLEQTNSFPARRTIALRRVGWLASEIDKWMAMQQVRNANSREAIPDWLRTT